MGILKLMDFLRTKFPRAVVEKKLHDYRGKTLTVDASNWIYQFLIKTQTMSGMHARSPTDSMDNQTGHLIGMLSRVAMCAQHDIKTIWVFDGKPPQEKFTELKRRRKMRQEAQVKKQVAIEEEQSFDLLKMSQRTVTFTQQQKNDAKKLIQLIGLPVLQSPTEAEPLCAEIVKQGLAYGTISEDMDTLAFGCPKLVRYFSSRDLINQVDLQVVLEDSKLTYQQFVDFCILCGCDYTSRIKSVGPVRAFSFIQEHKSIDKILKFIAKDEKLARRYTFQDDFNYLAARKIFKKPQIIIPTQKDVQPTELKHKQLVQFLKSKDFSQKRINNWLTRMKIQ